MNISAKDLNRAYHRETISKIFYPLNQIIGDIKKIIGIVLKKFGIYNLVKKAIRR